MIKKTVPRQAQAVEAAVNGRIMHKGNTLEVILLSLKPGEIIPLHLNPNDVIFAGIQGIATLVTPQQSHTLEAGETMFISADEQRSWQNNSPEICMVMVIKIL